MENTSIFDVLKAYKKTLLIIGAATVTAGLYLYKTEIGPNESSGSGVVGPRVIDGRLQPAKGSTPRDAEDYIDRLSRQKDPGISSSMGREFHTTKGLDPVDRHFEDGVSTMGPIHTEKKPSHSGTLYTDREAIRTETGVADKAFKHIDGIKHTDGIDGTRRHHTQEVDGAATSPGPILNEKSEPIGHICEIGGEESCVEQGVRPGPMMKDKGEPIDHMSDISGDTGVKDQMRTVTPPPSDSGKRTYVPVGKKDGKTLYKIVPKDHSHNGAPSIPASRIMQAAALDGDYIKGLLARPGFKVGQPVRGMSKAYD